MSGVYAIYQIQKSEEAGDVSSDEHRRPADDDIDLSASASNTRQQSSVPALLPSLSLSLDFRAHFDFKSRIPVFNSAAHSRGLLPSDSPRPQSQLQPQSHGRFEGDPAEPGNQVRTDEGHREGGRRTVSMAHITVPVRRVWGESDVCPWDVPGRINAGDGLYSNAANDESPGDRGHANAGREGRRLSLGLSVLWSHVRRWDRDWIVPITRMAFYTPTAERGSRSPYVRPFPSVGGRGGGGGDYKALANIQWPSAIVAGRQDQLIPLYGRHPG